MTDTKFTPETAYKYLCDLAKECGVPPDQLAREARISRTTPWRWANGQENEVRFSTIAALEKAARDIYGVEVEV